MNIDETIKACIHCGICLPACPTYQVTANEANSPRGRLYLINDLVRKENITDKKTRIKYLDDCLSCFACESVCPSNVQYHSILDYARKDLKQSNYNKGPSGLIRKFAFSYLLPNRSLLHLMRKLYELTSSFIPLHKLSKIKVNFDKPYKKILSNHTYQSSVSIPDLNDEKRTVSLILGCVMDTVYNHVHWDTINLLHAFGYHVYIPESNCCGALAYHSHEEKIGTEQLIKTENILKNTDYPIIINSAGCGAFIKTHSNNLKIMDLIEALQKAPFNPLENNLQKKENSKSITAVYHPACHLNHMQHIAYDYLDLLKKIPELKFVELYDADTCCGSAGFYNLIKAEMAEAIGKRKIENIKNTKAKLVISANPGCLSQIQNYLNDDYQVEHPATTLARYLKDTGSII